MRMSARTNFFPQGLATGNNFCNREEEQIHLANNIRSARPTLIISPRRYGKTSLVIFVLECLHIPFTHTTKFSLSSAAQAIKFLDKRDYVFVDEDGLYGVLDPLINYIFSSL